jgi:glutamate carboxypeptidase
MTAIPLIEFERRLPDVLALLRRLVELESPTDQKPALDLLGQEIGREMARRGAVVQRIPQPVTGDHWTGVWGGGRGGTLLLAHMDTVYPLGSLGRVPFRQDGPRLFGPGVLDMKGGLTVALTALEALRDTGRLPASRITLLCTSDEERGSQTSRPLLEDLAQEHDLILCLEPGLPDGSVKTWRKGIGEFVIEVTGRAAHAGANPEAGVSAIAEMSRQMERILGLADPAAGTTVNPGVIAGGTYSNVVAEACRLEIDVRVLTGEEQVRVQSGLASLQPVQERATLSVRGGWNRPPMPRTAAIVQTYEKARRIAAGLGMSLGEGGSGGGSDANFVAALGLPVLDGLGPVGNHAHSDREYIVTASLARRAALLAACLTEWEGA